MLKHFHLAFFWTRFLQLPHIQNGMTADKIMCKSKTGKYYNFFAKTIGSVKDGNHIST